MADIREIRVVVEISGVLRRLCKVVFTKSDASFYIFPYSPTGKYFFGSRSMPSQQFEDKVNFREGNYAERVPKLSIHESGQVHVIAADQMIGPLRIPSLSSLRGQHVATVGADTFDILPRFDDVPSSVGAKIDHVVPVAKGTQSGHLAFYVAGDRPAFEAQDCGLVVTMRRRTLPNPVFVGIKPIGHNPLGEIPGQGVFAIAGWDPTGELQESADYMYVRGI